MISDLQKSIRKHSLKSKELLLVLVEEKAHQTPQKKKGQLMMLNLTLGMVSKVLIWVATPLFLTQIKTLTEIIKSTKKKKRQMINLLGLSNT